MIWGPGLSSLVILVHSEYSVSIPQSKQTPSPVWFRVASTVPNLYDGYQR